MNIFHRLLAFRWNPFQISSSSLLLQKPLIIFTAGKTCVGNFGKQNEKAHNSTEFTNRKWEIKPAHYYLKLQNLLIINGIWLEAFWNWYSSVSISRAKLSLQEHRFLLPTFWPLSEHNKTEKLFCIHIKSISFLVLNLLLFFSLSPVLQLLQSQQTITHLWCLPDRSEVQHFQKMLLKRGRLQKQNPRIWEIQHIEFINT